MKTQKILLLLILLAITIGRVIDYRQRSKALEQQQEIINNQLKIINASDDYLENIKELKQKL